MSELSALPAKMQKARENIGSEARSVIESFTKNLEDPKKPELLYHYTDDVGLQETYRWGEAEICRSKIPCRA